MMRFQLHGWPLKCYTANFTFWRVPNINWNLMMKFLWELKETFLLNYCWSASRRLSEQFPHFNSFRSPLHMPANPYVYTIPGFHNSCIWIGHKYLTPTKFLYRYWSHVCACYTRCIMNLLKQLHSLFADANCWECLLRSTGYWGQKANWLCGIPRRQ